MTSKEQLRKQADFVAKRFKQLNDDFLVMYGYLIYEHLDGKKINAQDETRRMKAKIMYRSKKVKSDMTKIFDQQYEENGFDREMVDYMIMFPEVLNDLQNAVGVTFTENGSKVFVSMQDAIKKAERIDKNNAERYAKQVADSGLRIQSGDLTYRIDNYARYATLKGIKDINLQVQDILAEKMGATGWEIDYHDNPRPSHAYMGGRQFVIGKARTINGIYFESFEEIAATKLVEPNCLHFKIPIICGVTKPLHTTEQLAQWRKADQAKVKYAGRTYTKYEATQVQRRLEDEIRKCDDRITVAKFGSLDVMRRLEQSKRLTLFKEYEKFSKSVGLEMRMKKR